MTADERRDMQQAVEAAYWQGYTDGKESGRRETTVEWQERLQAERRARQAGEDAVRPFEPKKDGAA